MLVYGDHSRSRDAVAALDRVRRRLLALPTVPHGLAWHSAGVALLLDLGVLLQGIADRESEAAGYDDRSPLQDAIMAALLAVAKAVRRSWHSNFADQASPDHRVLDAVQGLGGNVVLKEPEGYAFYAVYPEAYLDAASTLPASAVVIGLRSIGTALAAVVAEASSAAEVLTVRPRGRPFARRIAASPALDESIVARASGWFVIVDEGPGLSGSSFAGTADWLHTLGVARERIIMMPSHTGEPGAKSSPEHRQQWRTAPRLCRGFDQTFLDKDDGRSLTAWFEDLTGKPLRPLVDLSGAAWAAGSHLPVDPGREARKFLLDAERGRFRLKFAGLGAGGEAKLARAEALHNAGFGVRPLALRHGFLLEDHVDASSPERIPVERLGAYLAFRAQHFPAGRSGTSLAELAAMASHNFREAGLDAGTAATWAADLADQLQPLCHPVHIDARLHAWEWLDAGGRLIKTDALDHAQAHDLVGCQDIAWDVAGAIIEHRLDTAQAGQLGRQVLGGRPRAAAMVRLMTYCYLAFQTGWWSFSSAASGQDRSRWYAATAAAWLLHADATSTSGAAV